MSQKIIDPNIERKAPADQCKECGAKLDLEQQLAQANGKTACHECPCSTGNNGDPCNLPDCLKCGPAFEAAMDLPDDYSSRQDYGRTDARLSPFG